jgi:hypothetical protein
MTISLMTILCSLFAWSLVVGCICSSGVALVEGWKHLRRLHQVPCSKCIYFTGDYNLKCTVRPCSALTEQAIGCLDFESERQDRARIYNPVPNYLWKYINSAKSRSLSHSAIDISIVNLDKLDLNREY